MRTFIAVELPTQLHPLLQQLIQQIQDALKQAGVAKVLHWTPIAKSHLTLRFLGETTPDQVTMVSQALRQQLVAYTPFALHLAGLGCFPNSRHPSVVWSGVGGDLATLQRMQNNIEQIVQSVGLAAADKPFKPHLTLGRLNRNAAPAAVHTVGDVLQTLSDTPAINAGTLPFTANQITFMQSDLRPEGAIYTPLAQFVL